MQQSGGESGGRLNVEKKVVSCHWCHVFRTTTVGRKTRERRKCKKQILAPLISNCLSLGFKSYKTVAKELRQNEKTMLKCQTCTDLAFKSLQQEMKILYIDSKKKNVIENTQTLPPAHPAASQQSYYQTSKQLRSWTFPNCATICKFESLGFALWNVIFIRNAQVYQNREKKKVKHPQPRNLESPASCKTVEWDRIDVCMKSLNLSFSFSKWCFHYSSTNELVRKKKKLSCIAGIHFWFATCMHTAFSSRNSSCCFLFAGRRVSSRADGEEDDTDLSHLSAAFFPSRCKLRYLILLIVLCSQCK